MHTRITSPTAPGAERRHRAAGWPAALAVDVALVLLFAGLGRNAHALDPGGLLGTAWPFLASLLAGWVVWRVHRAPAAWPRGVALWLTTVAGGILLRVVAGEDAAPSFVLVTLAVLGTFLLGPRVLAGLLARRRSRPAG